MRSSLDRSPSAAMISVRRSSPYLLTISASSSLTIDRCRSGRARMSLRSSMTRSYSASRSMIRCRSSAASRRSCMSKIAVACTSSISSSVHQSLARVVGAGARPDQRDHLVEGVQRLDQAAVDVGLALGGVQPVLGAATDDLDLVGDPVGDELIEPQGSRHVVDQGQHVAPERVLQLGVLVEVVQHHPRLGVPLEHDHQLLPGPRRGVVADVGDPVDLAGVDQLGDLEGQVVGVDHVRQLGDHQIGPARRGPPRCRRRRAW